MFGCYKESLSCEELVMVEFIEIKRLLCIKDQTVMAKGYGEK